MTRLHNFLSPCDMWVDMHEIIRLNCGQSCLWVLLVFQIYLLYPLLITWIRLCSANQKQGWLSNRTVAYKDWGLPPIEYSVSVSFTCASTLNPKFQVCTNTNVTHSQKYYGSTNTIIYYLCPLKHSDCLSQQLVGILSWCGHGYALETTLQSHNAPTSEYWTASKPLMFGKESERWMLLCAFKYCGCTLSLAINSTVNAILLMEICCMAWCLYYSFC